MDTVVSWIASPIPFIVLISVVITVHELGHYWAGRSFNAAIESFSLGFGSPLIQWKDKRGTRWRLNWLPLGGFVKFVGESQMPGDIGKVEQGPTGKPFTELNPWQRLAISLGGPAMNFIFAIVVFTIMALTLGVEKSDGVRVARVVPASSAEQAGFQAGDVLLQAGAREVKSANDVRLVTQFSSGQPVVYRVLRDGRSVELTATPIDSEDANPELGAGRRSAKIGLEMQTVNPRREALPPVDAFGYGVAQVGDTVGTTLWVISKLRIDSFSGPVGVFGVADGVTDMTMKQVEVPLWDRIQVVLINLTFMAAVLSIGVGFFNLLPIPVLDGGAAVMCIAEGLTGKQIPEKVQRVALTIGLACLVTFAVVVTWNDILKIRLG
jgi:regulator of sigma E protease